MSTSNPASPAKLINGPGTYITGAAAIAALLLTIIPSLADAGTALGVEPWVWIVATGVLGATVVVGKMWQNARGVQRPVKWGLASALGYLGAVAAIVMPLVAELRGSLDPLGVPQEVWVAISAGLLILTTLGRYNQASTPTTPIDQGGGSVATITIQDSGGSA